MAAASLAAPEDVHCVTSKIFLALCEDRISLKKAGMLSYLAQTLLRAHREMAIHTKLREEREEKEERKRQQNEVCSAWIVPDCIRNDDPPINRAPALPPPTLAEWRR